MSDHGHPPYVLLVLGLRGETLRYARGVERVGVGPGYVRQFSDAALRARMTDRFGRVVWEWERPFTPPLPGPVVSAAGTLTAVHRIVERAAAPAGLDWPATVCRVPVTPSGLWVAWEPNGLDPLCGGCWADDRKVSR